MRWCWVKPDSTDIRRVAPVLVDHAGDLVGDQQRRLARQRRRHRQALQFAAGQAAGVTFGEPVQADLGEQLVHVGGLAGRQPPHHVVGDAGAQHLALRVLHDHRGAAELAEADGAGTLDGPRSGFAAGEHQHQRGLARAVGAGHGEVLAGFHAQRHRAEGVVVGLGVAESDVAAAAPGRGRSVRRRSTTPACARRESRAVGPSPATAPTSR